MAIDIRSSGFDERAIRRDVKLVQMDGHHLQFDDNTFDVVFSFDTFEHIKKLEVAMQELLEG